MQAMKIRPRFETEDVSDRKFTRRIAKHNGKTFSYAEKTEKGGFMVYFPQGHSIHVRTERELKRLGFDRAPSMIDMVTGEEVNMNTSLKERSGWMTKVTKGSQSDGAETLDELEAA